MPQALINKFLDVRKHSESICAPLATEDYLPQPMDSVSPPKWHLAHTTWFYEYFILIPYSPQYTPYNKQYNYLFNSYYNYKGKRVERSERGNLSRPTVREVYAYRKQIDEAMQDFISKGVSEEVEKLIEIGLNHEQQHQELLLYDIKYILGIQPTSPIYDKLYTAKLKGNANNEWIMIEDGLYDFGVNPNKQEFSYDNESPQHKHYLNAFAIQSELVTNKDYVDFIEDGAYQSHHLWHSEAWDFINDQKISHPLYWQRNEGSWSRYTLSGLKPLDNQEAVMHLSFYEAAAFAAWRGVRLPTEFEWEIAADQLNWGKLWEWTNSAYLPYPAFQAEKGALREYNGKFMLNQMVLRGASFASPKNHSRKTYRNFYPANSRWLFSGIRLSKDI